MKLNLKAALVLAGCFSVSSLVFAQEPLLDLANEFKEIQQKEEAASHDQPSAQPVDKGGAPVAHGDAKKDEHAADEHKPHWGYSGMEAPRYWHTLAKEFSLCGEGRNQSPIDLRESGSIGTQGLPDLDIRYKDVPLKVINNGHTIQVNYPLGSYIKVGGKRFELLQYHFHTPSEHQKEGFNYPMEVHLVHRDGDGNLAVIGILFQEGQFNQHIDTLLQRLPKEVGKQEIHTDIGLNPVNFLPANTEFYKYSGSLTTPPCSEGVYWMVFKEPVEVSVLQIEKMNEVMGENARPVQPHNSRAVLKSWSEPDQDTRMYEFY